MEKQFNQDAKVFKAFCDPNRLRILDILKSGEHCACKLLEKMGNGLIILYLKMVYSLQ